MDLVGDCSAQKDNLWKKSFAQQLFCKIYFICRDWLQIKQFHQSMHVLIVFGNHFVRRKIVKPGSFGAIDVIYKKSDILLCIRVRRPIDVHRAIFVQMVLCELREKVPYVTLL